MSVQSTKMGFTPAKDRPTMDRIIASISGLEKQGKTHFALTAPGPIAFFSTDIGEEGVVNKFWDEKQIDVFDVERIVDAQGEDAAKAEWARVEAAYLYALRGKDYRTLIMDTATEMWELLRRARFGKLTQIMPYQYGPVNKEYRTLIREAYSHDKNLILLHKMKSQYINDKRTGEWERAGFSDTGFLVQVNAQVWRYEGGGDFAITINDCRQNPDLAGEDLEGESCCWDMMEMMVKG